MHERRRLAETDGTIKRIHVVGAHLRANKKDGESRKVITVQTSKGPIHGQYADIQGPTRVVYNPDKALSSGAWVWVETTAPVIVHEEVPDSVRG